MAKISKTLDSINGDLDRLTASVINTYLDRLDVASATLTDIFIDEGRGLELPSETFRMSDPLALLYQRTSNLRSMLRNEISRRYGPNAPRRLPTRQKR